MATQTGSIDLRASKQAYSQSSLDLEVAGVEQSESLTAAVEQLSSDIEDARTYTDQRASELQDNLSSKEELQAVDNVVKNYLGPEAYLYEDEIEGITIGNTHFDTATALRISSGEHSVVLHPQGLIFYDGSDIVAYLSDEKLYITKTEVIEEHRVGNFVWDTSSSGNFRLRYAPLL